jgi:hypothetical protein
MAPGARPFLVVLALLVTGACKSQPPREARTPAATTLELRRALDAYFDRRFEPDPGTAALVARLEAADIDMATLERMVRGPRSGLGAPPQPRGQATHELPLRCDHVDYETTYSIWVPKNYDPGRPTPLVIVGHGGNGAMSVAYAQKTVKKYFELFAKDADAAGFIIAVPATTRGWMSIGTSVVLSLVSKLEREYNLDRDRVYLTGHSMGGHLTWRSGFWLSDRWGAIGPMSGGYDYVKSGEIQALYNLPGYGTFGREEPYGIDGFNRSMRDWMAEHGFDFVLIEKYGGHEIYTDELPRLYRFFAAHPRDLYPRDLFARAAGITMAAPGEHADWGQTHTWTEGRPISLGSFRWLELAELPADVPAERRVQRVAARAGPDNVIEIQSENARRLRVYLHPKLVDLDRPVIIRVNGTERTNQLVRPDPAVLLETARAHDDRGRIFWARVDLELPEGDDSSPPEPRRAPVAPAPAEEKPDAGPVRDGGDAP